MRIGIIGGTGDQGGSLAKRLLKAGYEVRIGSRDEERGRKAAEVFKSRFIEGGSNSFACDADVIILAVPFKGIETLLGPLIPQLEGKVVLDITVPLIFGKYIKVDQSIGSSSYEYIRDLLPASHVVVCMKTLSASLLATDLGLLQTDFIIGIDDDAVNTAFDISKKLGLSPVRIRGKFHAHSIERMVALAIQINKEYPGSHCGYQITNLVQKDVQD